MFVNVIAVVDPGDTVAGPVNVPVSRPASVTVAAANGRSAMRSPAGVAPSTDRIAASVAPRVTNTPALEYVAVT